MKISQQAMEEVRQALEVYREEVNSAPLASATRWTYLRHADTFVRWLNDDFLPGEYGLQKKSTGGTR